MGIQLLRSHLGERGGKQGEGGLCQCVTFLYRFSLMKYLVLKLLTIITRSFVSLIKIPALLKLSPVKLNFICLFGLNNYDCWIPSKKEAPLKRVNIWIYIKISTPIFLNIFFLFHSFLHVVDLISICLNRQNLDNESSPNFASNIRQIWD